MMSSVFLFAIAIIFLVNGQRGKDKLTQPPDDTTTTEEITTTDANIMLPTLGTCFNPTGWNRGVENTQECGPLGSTGLRYCRVTDECIREAECPECDYADEIGGDIRWNVNKTACCDTLATVEENCRITGYKTNGCVIEGGGLSFSREYFARCPKCGNETLRTGTFGKEPCSFNDFFAKDTDKNWTLLVLPCIHGEFAFLDNAHIVSIKFVSVFIGIVYVFLY